MSEFVAGQDRIGSMLSRREPGIRWEPWARGWLGVLAVAIVNGALHRAYEPALGTSRAEQLSNLVLVGAVVPWAVQVDRRLRPSSSREAIVAGGLWGAMTVTFEFVGGRYLNGDDWRTLIRAYDLTAGHLWPVAVAGVVASPAAARWWRLRRH